MNELVTINKNNVPTTTSLKVAEKFGKRHNDVNRSIETLIDGGVRNFTHTPYKDTQNRSQKMYTMDRKAFMILVMGFTGEKALKFKQDFVDAFDRMEAYIRQQDKLNNHLTGM